MARPGRSANDRSRLVRSLRTVNRNSHDRRSQWGAQAPRGALGAARASVRRSGSLPAPPCAPRPPFWPPWRRLAAPAIGPSRAETRSDRPPDGRGASAERGSRGRAVDVSGAAPIATLAGARIRVAAPAVSKRKAPLSAPRDPAISGRRRWTRGARAPAGHGWRAPTAARQLQAYFRRVTARGRRSAARAPGDPRAGGVAGDGAAAGATAARRTRRRGSPRRARGDSRARPAKNASRWSRRGS